MYWNSKNKGKLKICSRWLKKGYQKFVRMKIENFSGKAKFENFFMGSEFFFGSRGWNLKQGQMHHCLRGDGRPCTRPRKYTDCSICYFGGGRWRISPPLKVERSQGQTITTCTATLMFYICLHCSMLNVTPCTPWFHPGQAVQNSTNLARCKWL